MAQGNCGIVPNRLQIGPLAARGEAVCRGESAAERVLGSSAAAFLDLFLERDVELAGFARLGRRLGIDERDEFLEGQRLAEFLAVAAGLVDEIEEPARHAYGRVECVGAAGLEPLDRMDGLGAAHGVACSIREKTLTLPTTLGRTQRVREKRFIGCWPS